MHRKTLEHFEGCLLGGAVGDALGAPVEFMTIEEIKNHFGPGGIDDFSPAYGKMGAITDDTQKWRELKSPPNSSNYGVDYFLQAWGVSP